MKLENILIGGGLFTVVFILFFGIYGESLSTYGVTGDNSSFGRISNNLKSYNDMNGDIKSKIGTGSVSDTDAVNQMVKGGYSSIRANPYTAVDNIGNITWTITKETGLVNPILIDWLLAALGIAVGITIVYLIMRYRTY